MQANDIPDDDAEDDPFTAAERAAAASRSTWVSVGVNLLLTTGQIAAGLLTKSQGLVADGIHSLSDLVADFVVLLANHHSQKDADEDHPYGHHRFETAASLALGVLLLVVGVGMLGFVCAAALARAQRDAISGALLAVTVVAAVIVTAQVPVPEQPAPLQPMNIEPALGAAVSVTIVPWA